MIVRIEDIGEKKLIGQKMNMSFSDDKTFALWSSFMPRRNEIKNVVSQDLISLQAYENLLDINSFDMELQFEKWALREVSTFDFIPSQMHYFILPAGKYAIFIHKGASSEAPKTFQYIFGVWLPQSEFELDNRPHFEVLGEKYKNNDPQSEEEVWIPIRNK